MSRTNPGPAQSKNLSLFGGTGIKHQLHSCYTVVDGINDAPVLLWNEIKHQQRIVTKCVCGGSGKIMLLLVG